MGWDVLLFDLDGTLTDSGPGIMHAAETALGSFGITGLSEQALRQFVGPPLVESFAVYLPQADVQTAIDRFRAYYRETGWLENEPYPGVRECLHALKAAGKRMYVATSKLESMARQVLTHFDLMQYFDGVCGGIADNPEAGKKVNVVRRALREAGCTEFPAPFCPATGNMIFTAVTRPVFRPSACSTATAAGRSWKRPVRTRLRKRRRRCWRFCCDFSGEAACKQAVCVIN